MIQYGETRHDTVDTETGRNPATSSMHTLRKIGKLPKPAPARSVFSLVLVPMVLLGVLGGAVWFFAQLLRSKLLMGVLLTVVLVGCTSAQAQLSYQELTSAGLSFVQAARANPALVEQGKTILQAAADKADPKDAPTINAVIGQLNANNLATAEAILAPHVAGQAAGK